MHPRTARAEYAKEPVSQAQVWYRQPAHHRNTISLAFEHSSSFTFPFDVGNNLITRDNHLTRFQHGLTMLVGVAYFNRQNIHGGTALTLACFSVNQRHDTCQDIAWLDRSKIFVLLLAVQNTHYIHTKVSELARHF